MRLKSIKSKEHTNVEANVQQCSNNHHFSRTPTTPSTHRGVVRLNSLNMSPR